MPGSRFEVPKSIVTKPFAISEKLHHLEKFEDSQDSVDEEIKEVNDQMESKKDRLIEIL